MRMRDSLCLPDHDLLQLVMSRRSLLDHFRHWRSILSSLGHVRTPLQFRCSHFVQIRRPDTIAPVSLSPSGRLSSCCPWPSIAAFGPPPAANSTTRRRWPRGELARSCPMSWDGPSSWARSRPGRAVPSTAPRSSPHSSKSLTRTLHGMSVPTYHRNLIPFI